MADDHAPASDTSSGASSGDGPGFSPEQFRERGYAVIDWIADWLLAETKDPVLSTLADGTSGPGVTPGNTSAASATEPITGAALAALLDEDLPADGADFEYVFTRFQDRIAPYTRKNAHPRFWAYVSASADPVGVLADALISALNQNVTSWRSAPSATTIERLVLRWLDDLVGFAGSGHGMLVSGGSAANFHATACAIQVALDRNPGSTREQLCTYQSDQIHLSMPKAARVLGIRPQQIRTLPITSVEPNAGATRGSGGRSSAGATRGLDVDALQAAIVADREQGLIPTAVFASAGTANSGGLDPLDEIVDLCQREGIWLHIDGAYGALAAITPAYADLKHAFARADSISLDPHKWLYAPLDVGCILVRDPAVTRQTFSLDAAVVEVHQTDPIERFAFFDHGLELSRRFRALKLWMLMKLRGQRGIRALIEHDIKLREYLDHRIEETPDLESLGSGFGIACFRHVLVGEPTAGPGTANLDGPAAPATATAVIESATACDERNRRILEVLLASGEFLLSPTTLDGRFALRVCIINMRTRHEDIDRLVEAVLAHGAMLV